MHSGPFWSNLLESGRSRQKRNGTPSLLTWSSHRPCGFAIPIHVTNLSPQTKVSDLEVSCTTRGGSWPARFRLSRAMCVFQTFSEVWERCVEGKSVQIVPPSADTDGMLLSKTTIDGLVASRLLFKSVARPHPHTAAKCPVKLDKESPRRKC